MQRSLLIRKRFPTRDPRPLAQPPVPMEAWSMDFTADTLRNGREVRVLNIIDFNRESVWQEVQYSYSRGTGHSRARDRDPV